MTFDFFNDIFNINTGVKLSNGSFTFNYRGINGTGVTPSELIKEWFGYPIQTAYSLAGNLLNWKLYGNTKQQLLPDGYTQLESIESTSTQYLDLAPLTTEEDIEIRFRKNATSTSFLFGTNPVGQNSQVIGAWVNSTSIIVQNGDNRITKDIDTNWHTIKVTSTKIDLDEEEVGNAGVRTKFQDLVVFAARDDSSGNINGRYFRGDIAYIKVGTLNLVPAKRNSDNEVGMYDLVTNTFSLNAGTGSFIAGPVAPTPEVPIEIKSVGDKTRNLFDKNNATILYGYPSASFVWVPTSAQQIENGEITIQMKLEAGKTYTAVRIDGTGCIFRIQASDTQTVVPGQSLTNIDSTGTNYDNTKTFTVPSNATYVLFYVRNIVLQSTITIDDIKNGFMLVEGSTAPTSYIPYGYRIPIVIGSNCGVVDFGSLNLSGNNGIFNFNVSGRKSGSIVGSYLNGYTQVYSYGNMTSTNKSFYFGSFTDLSNTTTYIHDDAYTDATAFKQAMSGKYLYYQRATDTSWTPPTTTPIYLSNPLAKIDTNADYIERENQQAVRNVRIKAFDGTEDWDKNASANYYRIAPSSIGAKSNTAMLCTHFKHGTLSVIGNFNNGETFVNFHPDNSIASTIAEWKAWLASKYANGTPVIVVYQLATPVTEQLTVPALTMVEGTNIITTDTEISPSDMYCRGRVSQL